MSKCPNCGDEMRTRSSEHHVHGLGITVTVAMPYDECKCGGEFVSPEQARKRDEVTDFARTVVCRFEKAGREFTWERICPQCGIRSDPPQGEPQF